MIISPKVQQGGQRRETSSRESKGRRTMIVSVELTHFIQLEDSGSQKGKGDKGRAGQGRAGWENRSQNESREKNETYQVQRRVTAQTTGMGAKEWKRRKEEY